MNFKFKCMFLNNKFKSLILLVSCLSFFVVKSAASINGMISSIIFAILIYFLIVNIYKSEIKNKYFLLLSILLIIVFLFSTPNNFYNKWIVSNKALMVSKMLNIELGNLLYIIGYSLSLLSIYFIYCFVITIILCLKSLTNLVDFKQLFNSIVNIFKKHKISEYFLCFLKTIFIVIVFAIIGSLVITFAFENKTNDVNVNVKESAILIKDEGVYPSLYKYCTSQLDNFTDAIMLLESGNEHNDSFANKAMLSYCDSISNENPYDVLIDIYVNDKESLNDITYARYWHGYLSILIPLLSIMNYIDIRIANGICQTILAIILVIILYKKKMKYLILPYIISIMMLCLPAIANSLQFSSCYYVMTIGALLVLIFDKTKIKPNYIFLFVGILVAYFDFLTYPIATFGFPMITYYACNTKDNLETKLYDFIKLGLHWGLGYGLMWICKWIIATIITDENVISNALNAFAGRTSNTSPTGYSYSIIDVVSNNVGSFIRTPYTIAFIVFVLFYVYRIYKFIVNKNINNEYLKKKIETIIPYALICILPFLWYIFATNHSAIHYWFTNKALVISAFSIMACLANFEKDIRDEYK